MKKILILLFLLTGCKYQHQKCTTPGASRCHNNAVEICTGDSRWRKHFDCKTYGHCDDSGELAVCTKKKEGEK